jgi:beta-galactosidase/beta-glucuronidase
MSKSRVKRAVLTDCEVSECVVIGTEFRGMRLRFGVWKNGRLVGRVGDGEVVFEEMDKGKKGKDVAAAADAKVERLDYKILQEESESEEDDESSVSDEEAELPPPYAP